MTATGLPDAVTNRIFSVTIQLDGKNLSLFSNELVVRPLLISAGKQVGGVGMAIDGDFDRATGCVTLQPGKPVTVAFLLSDESVTVAPHRRSRPDNRRRAVPLTHRHPGSSWSLSMSNGSPPARDALDDKANQLFAGKVVRKDLVRKVKVGANVPVFVLEFLLGKYCASSDEMAIQMGLQVVNDTLANNYIRPDESAKAQSKVKENGKYTFIDKVKVRLVDSDYWAEAVNFGNKFLHIPTHYVRDYERLLMGGIWAQVDMRFEYDEESKGKNPFWIDKLTPIQIATFDLEEYRSVRKRVHDGRVDRSHRPEHGLRARRDVPAAQAAFPGPAHPPGERNYNLVELGPRGTGKSYVVQEVSPYTALLTGGTTVANLFGHMTGRQKGMVQIWDVVGFDEVADLQKMPKEVITTMKTYCESGTFQRGQEAVAGDASIAMFGNTNQPIDVMVQTGHLFAPMPDIIRDDMAFIDRLHFYLPGWEIPKMRNELFTDHYGFVVDYLAEALREMRKHNFTEIIDRHFSLGAHLNARDRKAVRKTVSGLMKILFPHGEVTQEELAEILELALEGRRRVKEQLKKMGSFEYYQTSFSYTLQETGEETVRRRARAGRPRPDLHRSACHPAPSTPPASRPTARSASTAWRFPSRAEPGS